MISKMMGVYTEGVTNARDGFAPRDIDKTFIHHGCGETGRPAFKKATRIKATLRARLEGQFYFF